MKLYFVIKGRRFPGEVTNKKLLLCLLASTLVVLIVTILGCGFLTTMGIGISIMAAMLSLPTGRGRNQNG